MSEDATSCDARQLRRGKYSSWLTKLKNDGAKARWFSSSTKRYFTIDYDMQTFWYAHSKDSKKPSLSLQFKDILGAAQLPRPTELTGLRDKAKQPKFGFLLKTPDRYYEFYTTSELDAQHWVAALNAAKEIGSVGYSNDDEVRHHLSSLDVADIVASCSGIAAVASPGRESSYCSSQDTTADTYDTHSISGDSAAGYSDDGSVFGGNHRLQPADSTASDPAQQARTASSSGGGYGGGYNSAEETTQRPPTYAHSSHPQPTQSPVDKAPETAPEESPATCKPATDDAFAALDALEEVAGPSAQPACQAGKGKVVPDKLLKEAIALVTVPGAKRKPAAVNKAEESTNTEQHVPLLAMSSAPSVAVELEQTCSAPVLPCDAPKQEAEDEATTASHQPAEQAAKDSSGWDSEPECERAPTTSGAGEHRTAVAPATVEEGPSGWDSEKEQPSAQNRAHANPLLAHLPSKADEATLDAVAPKRPVQAGQNQSVPKGNELDSLVGEMLALPDGGQC